MTFERIIDTAYKDVIKLWVVALDLRGVQESGSLLFFGEIFPKEFTAVFVIVAVNAEVFPVGSIGRIVQVISVFVVDGQEMSRLFIKFSAALGADEAMDLE